MLDARRQLLASVLIATPVVLCIISLWWQSGAAVASALLLVALAEPLGFADIHEERDADFGGDARRFSLPINKVRPATPCTRGEQGNESVDTLYAQGLIGKFALRGYS